jgi:branched-subunit amino acid transport protein AzlD
VTAAAVSAVRAPAVPRTQERIVTGLFFASLFVATFEKVHWNVAGQIGINDITTILFLIAYVATERRPLPRTSAIVLGFFAAFTLVYLAGYWDIETKQGLTQFAEASASSGVRSAGSPSASSPTPSTESSSWLPRSAVTTSTTSSSYRSRAERAGSVSSASSVGRTSTASTPSRATRITSG